jgi:hypothetical protein
LRFFVDNNLSERLANGMKAFGEDVIHLKEIFPGSTEDVSWLKYVGDGGLFLVTRDERVRWNPAEIKAIRDYRVGAFFLGGKNRSRCELIQQLVRNWPRMKELATTTNRPFAYRIPPSGNKFTLLPL